MKIKETLTKNELFELVNGSVVGIFPSMILSTDSFYDSLYDLCLGYYLSRSGHKTISPTYRRLRELIDEYGGYELFNTSEDEEFHTLNNKKMYVKQENKDTAEIIIGKLIRAKFLDKWNRIYTSLVSEVYSPLDNFSFTSHKDANNQDVNTHDTIKTKDGNNTDTTTYDTSVEDNGEEARKETITRDNKDSNDIYGFNSTTAVGESITTTDDSEVTVANPEDNTTHNLSTKTGTETKTFGVDESETYTGTDTIDYTVNENETKSGRSKSGAELIQAEIKLRVENVLFNIIYDDIDSIATLQIYI